MKRSVIQSKKDDADKMLEDFKNNNREMFNDMEILQDFLDFSIQPPKRTVSVKYSKNPYDLMIACGCLISILMSLIFKVQWLTIIVLFLRLLISFLIHLLNIDYDFLDDKFLLRFLMFVKDNHYIYEIVYILMLYNCRSPYLLKYIVFIISDGIRIISLLMKFFYLVRTRTLKMIRHCWSICDIGLIGLLSFYLGFKSPHSSILYFFGIIFFNMIRFAVSSSVLSLIISYNLQLWRISNASATFPKK